MNAAEAMSVLQRAAEYNGQRYGLIDAKGWAEALPGWITPQIGLLAVDQLFSQNQLDGKPAIFTPPALVAACKIIRSKMPEADPTDVVPTSSKGRYAATFTDLVNRVAKANPERNMNVSKDYFWVINVARGVLNGHNDMHGRKYPDEEYL